MIYLAVHTGLGYLDQRVIHDEHVNMESVAHDLLHDITSEQPIQDAHERFEFEITIKITDTRANSIH